MNTNRKTYVVMIGTDDNENPVFVTDSKERASAYVDKFNRLIRSVAERVDYYEPTTIYWGEYYMFYSPIASYVEVEIR